MKKENKTKLASILWSMAYLLAAAAIIVSSISIVNSLSFEMIYVSGSSMNPTLSGNPTDCDYGTIDKSYGAKKSLKRFQIVTTYYPQDTASYKIKRVMALPGETFKVVNNDYYIYDKETSSWGEKLVLNFERNLGDTKNYGPYTLKNDEYFVVGDNYGHSTDSFAVGPISFSLLTGVLVRLEGRCTVDGQGNIVEKRPYETRYFLGVDY